MAKTIIFCADGTWNGPGSLTGDDTAGPTTNVFKLFVNLEGRSTTETALLANEQESSLVDADGTVVQVAKYIHGVGDSGNFLVKALGGTMGAGLITRIVRGYTFISRNYLPGDSIVIVGFSRGAYTARALGGLIAAQGLLDARHHDLTDHRAAYRLGASVWYEYRENALQAKRSLLGRLQTLLLDLPHFVSEPPADVVLVDAPITAVAVWDTVGSLGIPEFTLKEGRVDAFQFADTALSRKVARGLHAVAVDEQRGDFTPTLWDDDPRITQMLFPGAHADVGGGYPAETDGCLADCSLEWMMGELQTLGVRFAASPKYRLRPLVTGTTHTPWLDLPWNRLPSGKRTFPATLPLAPVLLSRRAAGHP